jgi:DNA mismatch repair protein MutS
MSQDQLTPLMMQYQTIKSEYQDCLVLFQVGDFYELFYDDAKTAASFLGIALTKRGKSQGTDIPLCGVPLHTIDHYITKLVKGGFKIALCDQLEAPRPGTVVKRGVTVCLPQEH